jgi:hypothetical protein
MCTCGHRQRSERPKIRACIHGCVTCVAPMCVTQSELCDGRPKAAKFCLAPVPTCSHTHCRTCARNSGQERFLKHCIVTGLHHNSCVRADWLHKEMVAVNRNARLIALPVLRRWPVLLFHVRRELADLSQWVAVSANLVLATDLQTQVSSQVRTSNCWIESKAADVCARANVPVKHDAWCDAATCL